MKLIWSCLMICLLLLSQNGFAQTTPAKRDGPHDFDFEIGSWKIHLKRLMNPLTSSTTWVEFDGTSVTRKLWDGHANIEEFNVDSPTGHIQGLTLRTYNPESGQWSLHWANSKDGILGPPTIGDFKNGVGEFYDQEICDGRHIYSRFIWSKITADARQWEQAFSADGGKTWETNWIMEHERA